MLELIIINRPTPKSSRNRIRHLTTSWSRCLLRLLVTFAMRRCTCRK